MAKQDFLDLVFLRNLVFTEFKRLEFKKPDNMVGAKTAEQANVVEAVTCQIIVVVVDTVSYDADCEVPFAIDDTSTLASQHYYS